MAYVERWIARRYRRFYGGKRFASVIAFFSFMGIVLGVATLVVVTAVMNGFRYELVQRVLGLNGHVTLHAPQGYLHHPERVEERLQGLAEISYTVPVLEHQALVMADGTCGAVVRGVDPTRWAAHSPVAKQLTQGSLEQFATPYSAVLGHQLAHQLHVTVGDRIKLMAPEGKASLMGMLPHTQWFRIVALFDTGMHEYDHTLIFVPLASAQAFFLTEDADRRANAARYIEVFLHSPSPLERAKTQLLRRLEGSTPPVVLQDWQESNSYFFQALEIERNVMAVILFLFILVAVFNVITCLVMLVNDKIKDIAILRTMGAPSLMILRIFFRIGAWIGLSGTLTGVALGLAFATHIQQIRQLLEHMFGVEFFRAEIYFLTRLPARIETSDILQIVGAALALSFLATLYPAWRASRLRPVEALRHA